MVKLLYAYTDRLPRNPISGRSIHFAVDTSTIAMTLDVYSHLLPSMQQEAAGKIDDLFKHQ